MRIRLLEFVMLFLWVWENHCKYYRRDTLITLIFGILLYSNNYDNVKRAVSFMIDTKLFALCKFPAELLSLE